MCTTVECNQLDIKIYEINDIFRGMLLCLNGFFVYSKWKTDQLYCFKILRVSQMCSCIKSMSACVVYLSSQVFININININIKIHHLQKLFIGCTQNIKLKFRQDVCLGYNIFLHPDIAWNSKVKKISQY